MPPKAVLTLAAVQEIIDEHTKALMDEIKELKNEVASLRSELKTAKENSDTSAPQKKSFSDVIKTSVRSALEEENTKNEVIIKGLNENQHDEEDLDALCTKAQIVMKPSAVLRLGKRNSDENRPRLMKATFPTAFDARAFLSKIHACKKEGETTLKDIRCRPGRTSDEHKRYKALSTEVYQMNQKAKAEESFSLRPNGAVWKYALVEDRWKRVEGWTYTPSTQGNLSVQPVSPPKVSPQ